MALSMYIRCAHCKSSTWIQSLAGERVRLGVDCKGCGRHYVLEPAQRLGVTTREQYARAVAFAESHEIDLPSAYSVLLGLMTLEQARANAEETPEDAAPPGEPQRVAREEGAGAAAPADHEDTEFDPSFRSSVEQGYLTLQQAVERGSREAWARRVAERHGLSIELAYAVADNRLSLHAAIRQEAGPPDLPAEPTRTARSAGPVQTGVVVAAAVGLLAVVTTMSWRSAFSSGEEAARALAANAVAPPVAVEQPQREAAGTREVGTIKAALTRVVRDEQGRVVQVTGPDPGSVLSAFCSGREDQAPFEPVGLAASVPPSTGLRWGIVRDYSRLSSPLMLSIRRDATTGRWSAGTGADPIALSPVPEFLPLPDHLGPAER